MKHALRATAFALATVAPAVAGEVEPGDEVILLDEWREMTEGRIVWYSLRGGHWGKEYFHRGRDSATFLSAQGECVTAPWTYADGIFCFAYTGMDCFRHVRRDGKLLAIPLASGETQVIERITDGALSCEPPLSS